MTIKVKIREYKETDWPTIENLIYNAENFGSPFMEDEKKKIMFFKSLPEFFKVFIAEKPRTNEIVGYIAIEFRWKSVVILSIITHHDYLRKGIGKQLIQKIKDIGNEHPMINVIRVDTGDFMDYAQQFYLSCEFQICGYVSHDLSWFNHQVHFVYPLKGIEKRD